MKSKIITLFSLCLLAAVTLLFNACKDKDSSPIVLVVAERSSGKLFILDATTGAKTEVATVTTATGGGLSNIRGMIYHKPTNKIYASTTTNGDGAIYEIDPSNMQATALNSDPDDHWYGVADLLITSDNKLLGILWFRSASPVGYGPGLMRLSLNGAVDDRVIFSDTDICCGMGMVFGSSANEILIGSYGLDIYKSTLSGTAVIEKSLVPDGFSSDDPTDFAIQNMVKDAKGTIYAIVYNYEDSSTYLAKVDLANEKLTKIGIVGEGSSNRFHGLMLISKDLI